MSNCAKKRVVYMKSYTYYKVCWMLWLRYKNEERKNNKRKPKSKQKNNKAKGKIKEFSKEECRLGKSNNFFLNNSLSIFRIIRSCFYFPHAIGFVHPLSRILIKWKWENVNFHIPNFFKVLGWLNLILISGCAFFFVNFSS